MTLALYWHNCMHRCKHVCQQSVRVLVDADMTLTWPSAYIVDFAKRLVLWMLSSRDQTLSFQQSHMRWGPHASAPRQSQEHHCRSCATGIMHKRWCYPGFALALECCHYFATCFCICQSQTMWPVWLVLGWVAASAVWAVLLSSLVDWLWCLGPNSVAL